MALAFIGCLEQVFDLGISRDITNWAVEWLVKVCGNGPAVRGFVSWTLEAANARSKLLGRRSAVSTVAPGCVQEGWDDCEGLGDSVC